MPIGIVDVGLIGGIASIAIYYFVLRQWINRNDESNEEILFKPIQSQKNARSDSYNSSFVSKMQLTNRNVIIFYGSQTGTAEEFAGRLKKDAVRYGLKAMVSDPEECDFNELPNLSSIPNNLALFCMATYGEGDPTDNAQEFAEWLNNADDIDLSGINFGVFALGNKTYEHFNSMGKLVDTKLSKMGANKIQEVGLGDDDGNIEEDFVNWKDDLWANICKHFDIDTTASDISVRQYAVIEHENLPIEKIYSGEISRLGTLKLQKPPHDIKNPFLGEIVINRELHKEGSDRSCMHIEVSIENSKLRYEAGDHIAVYPTNDIMLVDTIGRCLEVDLDKVFSLKNIDEDANKIHPFPCPTTYRVALSHYLDITSTLRTNVLKDLAEFAGNEEDKNKLLLMASNSPEGHYIYNSWILKPHRTISSVLEDISSLKPPIDLVCELLPRLQPRYYSISSSPKIHPKTVHITAVLVDWTTPTNRNQKGVATSYLKQRKPSENIKPKIPVFLRKSQFRLPFKHSTPILMIGPGTGVAPFRGFIQDRAFQKSEGKPIGETVLYYGCRHKNVDYLYDDEFSRYIEDDVLTLHVAFSRDSDKKVYVQHLIEENYEEIWRILKKNDGHLYICGDAKNMAHDVEIALQKALEKGGQWTNQQAQDFLRTLKLRGRYSSDLWS